MKQSIYNTNSINLNIAGVPVTSHKESYETGDTLIPVEMKVVLENGEFLKTDATYYPNRDKFIINE